MKKVKFVSKLVSSVLALSVTLSASVCPDGSIKENTTSAAWDGYVETKVNETSFSVLNFNSIKSIENAGGAISNEYSVDGNMYSARWNNHSKNQDFYIKSFDSSVPNDWSQYTKITFRIYSKKATGAKIFVGLFCPKTSAGDPYFSTYIYADWEGWKNVTLKFNDLSTSRSPSLKKIVGVRLCADGNWNLTGNPETDLFISSIKVQTS